MKPSIPLSKNIIITHVYSSDNKGDAALTSVLIKDLKRAFKSASITILKLESVGKQGRFEGIPEKPSFMYFVANKFNNPLFKLAYALYMMSVTLVWALCLRYMGVRIYLPPHLREVAELYVRADLIVPVGGGYIRGRKGLRMLFNVPLLLHPLLFGYLLGKPTVLYSQSVGPFSNRLEEWLAAFVLKRMTLILLREDTSLALLASLGVSHNTMRSVDSGFLLRSEHGVDLRKLYKIPAGKLLVGVTVRSWLKGEAQAKYERAVARALDTLVITNNAHIIFIPQVTAAKGDDDRVVSRKVYNKMKCQTEATCVDDAPNHYRIKAMYDSLDMLLGTRFHSVIFSLTSYVPVLAIEYEHKTSGIMHDLHLDKWVIKIEEVTTEKLTPLLQKLTRRRQEYRMHLRNHLPRYIRRAHRTAGMLERAVGLTAASK